MASNTSFKPFSRGDISHHPVDLYIRLAGSENKFGGFRQVQEWLKFKSVHDVAEAVFTVKGLSLPAGDNVAITSLSALCAWGSLPDAWLKLGCALLWGRSPEHETLVDCDGQSWESSLIVAEHAELLGDPEGYPMALTALNLSRAYRHILWEYLLRPDIRKNVPRAGFERDEEDLLVACLGVPKPLPPPEGNDEHKFIGELFRLDDDIYLVKDGIRWEVVVPDELRELLASHDLGRARLKWNGQWVFQWVEVGGDMLRCV